MVDRQDGSVVVGHTTWSFFDLIDRFIWTRELGAPTPMLISDS